MRLHLYKTAPREMIAAANKLPNRRRKAMLVLMLLAALPAFLFLLFVLNGTLLCDGTTPRGGNVASNMPAGDPDPDKLCVMAFNIAKCFVYQDGITFAERETVESSLNMIARIIRSANPDVVCLAEIVRECGPCDVDQVRFLAQRTGLTNWAFGECFSFGLPFYRMTSGNAIISRYPLNPVCNLNLAGRKPFYITKNSRRALACTVATPGGDLVFWSLHNDSFAPSNNLAQVQQLLEHPLAVNSFMAGDFNASPGDPSIVLIRQSGRYSGVFNGPHTIPAIAPDRTLDYILAPAAWDVQDHRVITNTASDHCAVLTVFRRKPGG
ncbi:MAG: hypothetical protein C0404_03540 [Verrucomicrobia bacterium]|nr:hypothetical protein [Verrucomicrobiota bacterium]